MARHELIGLHAKVVSSTHEGYVNIEGPIITESRNMIGITVGNSSLKRVPKKSVILELSIPDNGNIRIDGSDIVGRPENRIKMRRRKNR